LQHQHHLSRRWPAQRKHAIGLPAQIFARLRLDPEQIRIEPPVTCQRSTLYAASISRCTLHVDVSRFGNVFMSMPKWPSEGLTDATSNAGAEDWPNAPHATKK
jgi:hypothetical protein